MSVFRNSAFSADRLLWSSSNFVPGRISKCSFFSFSFSNSSDNYICALSFLWWSWFSLIGTQALQPFLEGLLRNGLEKFTTYAKSYKWNKPFLVGENLVQDISPLIWIVCAYIHLCKIALMERICRQEYRLKVKCTVKFHF